MNKPAAAKKPAPILPRPLQERGAQDEIMRCHDELRASLADAITFYQHGSINAETFLIVLANVSAEEAQQAGSFTSLIHQAEIQLTNQSLTNIKTIHAPRATLSRSAVMIDNGARIVAYLKKHRKGATLQAFVERYLREAFVLYQTGNIDFETFTHTLSAMTPDATIKNAALHGLIEQTKMNLTQHILQVIKAGISALENAFSENLALQITESQVRAKYIVSMYNSLLNYYIKIKDAAAIHAVITAPDNRFNRIASLRQLRLLLAVCNPQTALLLFDKAHDLYDLLHNHNSSVKNLQLVLLENPTFRREILAMGLSKLRNALQFGTWQVEDFATAPVITYGMRWLALTQNNLIEKLLATGELNALLLNLQTHQLTELFTEMPTEFMKFLAEEDLPLATRQTLARRLLVASTMAALGSYAHRLLDLGIFQLDKSYDLTADPENIYASTTIANLLVANWQGYNPWKVNVINEYFKKDNVSAQAFEFILSNCQILVHENLRQKNLKVCVIKAASYLTPSSFLRCVKQIGLVHPYKMQQILAKLPAYLRHSKQLAFVELAATQELMELYYHNYPELHLAANDRLFKALSANKHASRFAILGSLLFAPGRTAALADFLRRAEDYRVPKLIPTTMLRNFKSGVLLGICGYGLYVMIDRLLNVMHIANPLAWVQIPASVGSTFTLLVGSVTALLTGGGVATVIAMMFAPVIVSGLIGGVVNVLVCDGLAAIWSTLRNCFQGVKHAILRPDNKPLQEDHEMLMHGLRHADPHHLRTTLYAPEQVELRDNLAKMLLRQEANGYAMQSLPEAIRAVIAPVRDQYYHAHKDYLLKIADYTLGNILSLTAWIVKMVTLAAYDANYNGPILRHFAYQQQVKLAAPMPIHPDAPLKAKDKRQAQIMRPFLIADPAKAYQQNAAIAIPMPVLANDNPPPPAYAPPAVRGRRLGAG